MANNGYNPYDNNPFATDTRKDSKSEADANRQMAEGVTWQDLNDPHFELKILED